MREEFEKLPKIAEMLKRKDIYYGDYYGSKTYMVGSEPHGYLNGAWYIYQEQQKNKDAIKQKLHDIYNIRDEDETVAMLLDEIQELLK